MEEGVSRRDDEDVGTDLFRPTQELFIPDDFVDQPRLTGGGRPRGLMANGLVRTTGWLQFGSRPISTGLVSAGAGLLVGATVAVPVRPAGPVAVGLVLVLVPGAAYGLWWLLIRLRPASAARNVDTASVRELRANDWIRVYGSIGPVGQVASAAPGPEDVPSRTVRFFGGTTMNWPIDHRVHLVELSEVDNRG